MADVAIALEQKLRKMANHAAAAKHVGELLRSQDGATESAKAHALSKLLVQADTSVETLFKILELCGGFRAGISGGKRGVTAMKVAMGIVEVAKAAMRPEGKCSYCGDPTPQLCTNPSCNQSESWVHHYCVQKVTLTVR